MTDLTLVPYPDLIEELRRRSPQGVIVVTHWKPPFASGVKVRVDVRGEQVYLLGMCQIARRFIEQSDGLQFTDTDGNPKGP